jgi:ATP-dependent DNA helicase RecQ
VSAAPATVKKLREALAERFGFQSFRPGQLQAVRSAMTGRDVLAVMPTGSGKSLCFQLPALELEGVTVVVSPLIALMKDQADDLRAKGIRVAVVNSSVPAAERAQDEADLAAGTVEFVYTTPEQLARPELRGLLANQVIDLFVVDEAHCVSQWGHDFRPDYLSLWEAIEAVGRPPVLAFTASATPDVIDDILARLHMPEAEVVHTGFYRPNLRLGVTALSGDGAKRQRLLELLGELDGTGIVYAATTKAVDDLTDFLDGRGVSVAGYHGKMTAKRRHEAQDAFMTGRVKVLVATNAFGLGIDKPDIRYVVHYHMPATPEAYYQEVGRAGRDGEPARGVLLFDPADQKLLRFFSGGRYPDDSDLVNTYRALERLDGSPGFDEVAAICPVPKAKLKVCLHLLGCQGIVRPEADGRFRLVIRHLDRDALARAAGAYQDRAERDRANLGRMAAFSEGRGCRWQALLGYFDADPLPAKCRHCDNCG